VTDVCVVVVVVVVVVVGVGVRIGVVRDGDACREEMDGVVVACY